MQQTFLILFIVLFSLNCSQQSTDKAQDLVDLAIAAHGSEQFENAIVAFDFRDKHYTVDRTADGYHYTRTFRDSSGQTQDILFNSSDLMRLINGDTVSVVDTMAVKYKNSVNSVLYFAQLPYLLNDPAVIKSYEGTQLIRENLYDVVRVVFKQSGGGEDFDDEYRYWIHADTHLVDFLAYTYSVNDGGTRFREAYRRSKVGGIVFQDYINYEVPVGIALSDIPKVFEAGNLKVLSRIENKNIHVEKH